MYGRTGLLALAGLALVSCSKPSAPIRIIGSSTVFPFSTAVAKAFVDAKKGDAPMIEETGTVTGFATFCASGGSDSADIADASRQMSKAEYQKCQASGVGDIMEIAIGLDGIAIAESNSGPKLALTRKDLYLALAANPKGKPNTAKTWKDVNPSLAAIPIVVMGPPPSSGTRDVFEQKVLQPGCFEAYPDAQKLVNSPDPLLLAAACRQIRADGPYLQGGENDDNIVRSLEQNPNAIGVFGYSFLEKNTAKLHGLTIDGFTPDTESIASGKYPATRSLYLYVKVKHLKDKPALKEFLSLYASMWEPNGPLTKLGLIAMSDAARRKSAKSIEEATPLDARILP